MEGGRVEGGRVEGEEWRRKSGGGRVEGGREEGDTKYSFETIVELAYLQFDHPRVEVSSVRWYAHTLYPIIP